MKFLTKKDVDCAHATIISAIKAMYYTDLSPQTLQDVTDLDQSTHVVHQYEVISG